MTPLRSIAAKLSMGLCLLYGLLRLPPWIIRPVGLSLDDGWLWTLHEARQRGLVFGQDVIFPSGPYGIAMTDFYHPASHALVLSIHAAMVATLVFATWWLLSHRKLATPFKVVVTLLVIESASICVANQSLFYLLAFVLILFHWARGSAPARSTVWLEHGLVVALALAALVKFVFLICAIIAIGATAAHQILVRRERPWLVASFTGALLFFWAAAGQPISGLGAYAFGSVQLTSHFGDAMSVSGPVEEILLYLLFAGSTLAWLGWVHWRQERVWAVLPLGAYAAFLFMLFKIAFVRHDVHATLLASVLLPWCLLIGVLHWPELGSRAARVTAALGALVLLVLSASVTGRHGEAQLPALYGRGIASLPARLAAAANSLTMNDWQAARHARSVAAIRKQFPLPRLDGRVDAYSWIQSIVLAHGFDLTPRPILQSYHAYAPYLAERNAQALVGGAAPDHIVFAVQPLGGILPALDDSLSWPELLARYELRGSASGFLLLDRSPSPRTHCLVPVTRVAGRLGEFIQAPVLRTDGYLWVEIEIDTTVPGKLAGLLFKRPAVAMALALDDGQRRAYRIVPSLAGAGFMLSPLVAETADFGRLFAGAPGGPGGLPRVDKLAIVATQGSSLDWAYHSAIEVRFFELRIGDCPR